MRERLTRIERDLAAIGPWAPVRVGYEVSRRSGLHARRMRTLPSPPSSVRDVNDILTLPGVDRLGARTRERTLDEAGRIAEGRIRLFSRDLSLGPDPDWHAVVHDVGRWPQQPWWTLELRSAERPGDVKWVWELGRHRHLVVLARAATIDPDERVWFDALTRQLRSFLADNPPERGVQWCSSLELALRAFAWLEIISRVGDRLDGSLRSAMAESLWFAGMHIVSELPYSLSSMQNNHLLGEAAGLAAIGSALGLHRWVGIGRQLFAMQSSREFQADGSTIEESLSYQRFVMDIVAMHVMTDGGGGRERTALGLNDPSRAVLCRGADFLIRLGVLDGPVPQFGDWDEGRALVTTGDPQDFSGIVHLARALGGRPLPPPADPPDELAWYATDVAAASTVSSTARVPVSPQTEAWSEQAETNGAPVGGGIARAARGDLAVWLRAGSTRWHAHADLCSISIRWRDEWIVGDPGTGSYNGDDDERAWFRSSAAHSVLELDGRPLVLPHRAFRWQDDPWCALGPPIHDESMSIIWGAHRAYGAPVARAVIVEPDEVAVLDSVSPIEPNPRPYALRYALGPEARWSHDGQLELPGSNRFLLHLPNASAVDRQASAGRWSPTYGHVVPSTSVVARGIAHGPLASGLTANHAPRWVTRGHALHRGSTRVGFRWRGTVIALHLTSPLGSFTRELRMPS